MRGFRINDFIPRWKYPGLRFDSGRLCFDKDWQQGLAPLSAQLIDGRILRVCARREWDELVWEDDTSSSHKVAALARYTDIMGILASPEALALGVIACSAYIPPEVAIWNIQTDHLAVVSQSLNPPPPATSLAEPEALSWRSFDGMPIHGLYYHPHAVLRRNPPLIVLLHDGPAKQVRATWPTKAHFFNAQGYGVLYVNYRGSTGYGPEYQAALDLKVPESVAGDAASGALYVLGTERASSRKIFLFGGGWAGGRVIESLSHWPDVFAGGIAVYPEIPVHRIGATIPKRPLLLFHGALDAKVPVAHSEKLCQDIQEGGGQVSIHIYPEEGHGWKNPATYAHYYRTILDFLARTSKN